MDKSLPARPNLDHLRRQAKSLLAALSAGDADAGATFQEFLPAAGGMSVAQVRAAGFRLADAQSAIARKSGFAGWPQLARHVEQLRAMEGTWSFARLELDGAAVPPEGLKSSRLLIDGDRFRTEAPEAIYEGVFNIDVEARPHHIDIEFVEGPEAGNWNYGIFRIDGDRIDICLDMTGKSRPSEFATSPGSGCAYETLHRSSSARPPSVTGGDPAAPPYAPGPPCATPAPSPASPEGAPEDTAGFEFVATPTLMRLQGDWTAQKLVRDGQELAPMVVKTGLRTARDNEVKAFFGGQLMIHVRVRINEATRPIEIDYLNVAGAAKGTVQLGIMEWRGTDACFCTAAPGQPRPTDFGCPAGSNRTLSVWRPKPPARSRSSD